MCFLFFKPGSSDNSLFLFEGEDKLAHGILFFAWSFCFSYLIGILKAQKVFPYIVLILVIGLGFGGISEYVQTFIPNRSASFLDFAADTIGVVLGLLIIMISKKELIRIEKKFDK
ncbi:MAG: VanZ family protein [Cyclobacteriaceae bacterium]